MYFTPDDGKLYIDAFTADIPKVGPSTLDGKSNRICLNDSMERLVLLRCGDASTLGKSTIAAIPKSGLFDGGSVSRVPIDALSSGGADKGLLDTDSIIYYDCGMA